MNNIICRDHSWAIYNQQFSNDKASYVLINKSANKQRGIIKIDNENYEIEADLHISTFTKLSISI